jgi:hypothetical protein
MPFPVATAARIVAGTATSISVGKVISEVIKNNTSPVTRLDKIQMQVAGTALSLVIAGAATAHVEGMVKSIVEKTAALQAERNIVTPS